MSNIIEKVIGDFGEKRRWKQHKARIKALPDDYRVAAEALERYLMHYGAIAKSDVLMSMLEDLGDLFEQSVVDGVSIRDIVGDDPVEFAETFLRNYTDGQWINKERRRLTDAINRAAGDDA